MFKKKRGQALRRDSGQSTVEYILLATAVIGAMIFFTTGPNSALTGRLGNTLNSAANSIGSMSNRLTTSEKESPIKSDLPPVGFDPGTGFNQQ